MFTITAVLVFAAFACALLQTMGKCPSGVAPLLLCVVEMIRLFGH
jgi:hypothetical protein